jgi:hypothetical protein
MSFDLFVWDPPTDASDDDVRERYGSACEDEEIDADKAAGESERVNRFFDALVKRHPRLDDLGDDDVDGSPWSSGPERGDRWVSFTIRLGGAGDAAVADIERLATEHALVLYDPQSDEVHQSEPKPGA